MLCNLILKLIVHRSQLSRGPKTGETTEGLASRWLFTGLPFSFNLPPLALHQLQHNFPPPGVHPSEQSLHQRVHLSTGGLPCCQGEQIAAPSQSSHNLSFQVFVHSNLDWRWNVHFKVHSDQPRQLSKWQKYMKLPTNCFCKTISFLLDLSRNDHFIMSEYNSSRSHCITT